MLTRAWLVALSLLSLIALDAPAQAISPTVSCHWLVYYWPNDQVVRGVLGDPHATSIGAELAAHLRVANKTFGRQGFFIVTGEMTAQEQDAKSAWLSLGRAESAAHLLHTLGIPATRITVKSDSQSLPGPTAPFASIVYCWKRKCACPYDPHWQP